MMGKVLIAMSGGVDSSVAAYLLKHSGWDCVGATMTLYRNEDIGISRMSHLLLFRGCGGCPQRGVSTTDSLLRF